MISGSELAVIDSLTSLFLCGRPQQGLLTAGQERTPGICQYPMPSHGISGLAVLFTDRK